MSCVTETPTRVIFLPSFIMNSNQLCITTHESIVQNNCLQSKEIPQVGENMESTTDNTKIGNEEISG